MARGSVRRRGSRWTVILDVGPNPVSGKRRQRWKGGYRTRKAAETALRELMAEVDAGAYVARSGVTVAAYLDDWLTTVESRLGPTTWNSYRIAVGRINSALGATLVQSLTPLEDGRVGRLPRPATGSGLVGPDPTAQSRLGGGAHQRRRSLVGFVNVAWDGGDHAFLLDTKTRGEWHRRGVGTDVVGRAARHAQAAGGEWLHVDFEPHLRSFYIDACGFRPTDAGLIRLHSLA